MPLAFTNVGRTTCALEGYGAISMLDAKGVVLPFRYGHSSLYFVTAHPALVVLHPGGHAYEIVAKYRCDLGEAIAVARMRIVVPGSHEILFVSFGGESHRSAYCKGGRDDPGNLIGVATITRSRGANLPR